MLESVITSAVVTILTFAFGKFSISGNTKRAIVFVLSIAGAVIQLAVSKQLGVSSDPATWYTTIATVIGGAQVLYGAIVKPIEDAKKN